MLTEDIVGDATQRSCEYRESEMYFRISASRVSKKSSFKLDFCKI